jgi:formylglycine-generating enzyme required for sulfatase activity
LVGDATIGCTITGFWAPAPNCSPVDCGEPPVIEHGERTFAETTLGSSVSYTCNAGYAPVGAATISCTTTGSWTTAPNCEDINECVAAATVCDEANNVCTNREGSWECSCDDGYIGMPIVGGNTSCLSTPPEGLGAACIDNSDCPANSWCSTVSGFRVCSPRLFGGSARQMDFVLIPAGTFEQGTPGATNEERPYTATITRNYFVSRTEITQAHWKAATRGTNRSCFQSVTGTACTTGNANDNGPMERVDWYAALGYANWLSSQHGLTECYTLFGCNDIESGWHEGRHSGCDGAIFSGLECTGYRLLTESEWERAARGGTTSNYFWGTAVDVATVGRFAWFNSNSGGRTQQVGIKLPNAYGLYDMSGNVWEWIWDWVYAADWISYPTSSTADYLGPANGTIRGLRGGSYATNASNLRSAERFDFRGASSQFISVGFRLARTAP